MTQSLPTPSLHEHRKATRKMRWWYEQLADFMISHPQALQNEIAAHFGRTPATISTIINSDAFKAYYSQRRTQYVGALDTSVREKMLKVADAGFDLILDRFERKKDTLPLETINKSVELVMKASGHGQAPQVVVNNNSGNTVIPVAISLDDLQEAQRALRAAQSNPYTVPESPTIDGECEEVNPQGTSTASLEDLA